MSLVQDVERGAQWLDRVYPEWVDVINLDKLNMSNSSLCVWGQITKLKSRGWDLIMKVTRGTTGNEDWVTTHGFETYFEHGELTALWTEEIKKRRLV